MKGNGNRSTGPWAKVTIVIAVTAVFLVFLEGVSSLVLGSFNAFQGSRSYQVYHEVYGWTALKNTDYPDFFGPGKYIKINGQGFREDSETSLVEIPGSPRIICSGDSFTFGQGVANNETWCHLLPGYLPGIDTVNLGLTGYGVDQSYLRYMDAGIELQHRVHVFAFISDDLARMSVTRKWDSGKPKLLLKDDDIEVTNVPVPRFRHWLTRKARAANLRMVDLGDRILTRLLSSGPAYNVRKASLPVGTRKVAQRVFRELVAAGRSAGRETLFVYLPTEIDLARDLEWRNWTREIMVEMQYPFLDLTPAMRQLPASRVAGFFIDGGAHGGHYTYAGNRWVSENIARVLDRNFGPVLLKLGSKN